MNLSQFEMLNWNGADWVTRTTENLFLAALKAGKSKIKLL